MTCQGQSFAQLALLLGFRRTKGWRSSGPPSRCSSEPSLEPALHASLIPVLAAATPTRSCPQACVCAVPDGRMARRSGARRVLCGWLSCSGPMIRMMQMYPRKHVSGWPGRRCSKQKVACACCCYQKYRVDYIECNNVQCYLRRDVARGYARIYAVLSLPTYDTFLVKSGSPDWCPKPSPAARTEKAPPATQRDLHARRVIELGVIKYLRAPLHAQRLGEPDEPDAIPLHRQ